MRYFKPVIHGADWRDVELLEQQVSDLPVSVRETLSSPDLAAVDLYADSLRHAYHFVLRQIAENVRELAWPIHDDLDSYHNFWPEGSRNIELEVGIPLPGGTTTDQVQLVVSAARGAGIRNPVPVAEPTAALAYYFQSQFEKGVSPLVGSTVMVVDEGGGSADVQALYVDRSDHGFVVREMVPGDSEWCGGRICNEICREIVMEKLLASPLDTQRVLESLSVPSSPMTTRELQSLLEKEFEQAERHFSGDRGQDLLIRGFPAVAVLGNQAGRVPLSVEDMAQTFRLSIDAITDMIKRNVEEVREAGASVGKILVVGGGFNHRYTRNRVRHKIEVAAEAGYSIPVATTSENTSSSSTTVAYGTALLLADKAFISERIIRRGFCIIWDVPIKELENKERIYPRECITTDMHDGAESVMNVSKFLIRVGDRLPWERYVVTEEAWRGLSHMENGRRKRRWTISEGLCYCDAQCKDEELVDDPASEIHRMPSPITFTLSEAECRGFETYWTPSTNSRKWYYRVEYDVALILEGLKMTFELRIPRSGRLGRKLKEVYRKRWIFSNHELQGKIRVRSYRQVWGV
ncbi:hypothetical protein LTR10_018555 [Elasticomyces elasticus]|uniref:Ppx/GppA phosphatase domain-containing protein n=1 Tax=Exophiala sideris TaxID=1016849 RepID=A0ABR0JPC6_9EURO|nr:hypothetical protein LTR10_018555 [Elasticomyces elasticus]KAK5038036.1 hypothetical protein LTS07_001504 [Exophiala sideris]KAK5044018.1 hypothetical protein LTR13_000374 [Exophiala sideris]KAK5067517.1 hypothetical protein LTR69_001506 [Exophiala sideris]KAK5184245.1 hypothetical protein LTR44_003751 [Eurotiomycetes sp. CCFEE 6388]